MTFNGMDGIWCHAGRAGCVQNSLWDVWGCVVWSDAIRIGLHGHPRSDGGEHKPDVRGRTKEGCGFGAASRTLSLPTSANKEMHLRRSRL